MTQTADSAQRTTTPRVAVIGMHGYGAQHVQHAMELAEQGRLTFVAAADPKQAEPGQLPPHVQEFADAEKMIKDVSADIVTIATPIHTHLPFALAAVRAGADVLLEKPPVTSLAQFDELQQAADAVGRVVQVGFQSMGSAGIPALRQLMGDGSLGEITGISGIGLWLRKLDYWTRSPWAGRRELDGVEVNDGVITNPLAHATSAALALADAETVDGLAEVEVELLHGNDIQADDTSVVRLVTQAGLPVTLGLTLCVEDGQQAPYVQINGTTGRARFFYTGDRSLIWHDGQPEPEEVSYGRTSLLDNLIEHRAAGASLLSPLTSSGGFTRVMEAVRQGTPRAAHPDWVELRDDQHGQHVVIRDVEQWVERAALEHRTFSQLGARFAGPSS